ncbi:phenylacetate--CoA ligase family protein [Alicyclobacillus tolerans]|uniref:phenylacetate--CoA ligase family protein n=1 Tax=Alicyclobacillus tolerans TaxID=90970 RepID=UPI001F15FFDB|nr:phenylacetate--CoA ligase family protein [Alicyclobacillus tolerans]MCF8566856.1 phenylacetate--CoA ligase family protein [Alicyclobacillus tolerans]
MLPESVVQGGEKYWSWELETMDPEQRKELILQRIQSQLSYVYENLPFYRDHYDKHGFHPSMVKTLDDFSEKVPIITKKMLVENQAHNPIFGSYAGNFSMEEIERIQGSSGTSGTPTLYCVSRKDWERSAEISARALWSIGVRAQDIVQISFPFSLFFAGWGVLQGVERIGATAFPLGVTDSERQLALMDKVGSTVFSATPSYAIHLISVAKQMGLDLRKNKVKKLFVGGEPGGSLDSVRQVIEDGWGADVYESGSCSEMYPFNTSTTCEAKAGVHLYLDEVYSEIVDKDDPNRRLPMGERGAIVYTHLWRQSQPMIRFWPGDESYMTDEPCSCGRTYPRLPEGVLGRLDDMVIIRGANVYPSAIDKILRSVSGVGPEYQVILEKQLGGLDEITVRLEYDPEVYNHLTPGGKAESLDNLAKEAAHKLKTGIGIRFSVEVIEPGELPATVVKAKRVIDRRKQR